MFARVLPYLLCMLLPFAAQAAVSVQNDITRATLITDTGSIKSGTPFMAGVLLEPKDGWHTYWENPGDAGLATVQTWQLPKDFSATGILWPVPERINEGPLTIYGYHDTVMLPVRITPPDTLDATQPHTISVKADWLVCKDICIPESAILDIALNAGEPVANTYASLFAQQQQKFPKPINEPFTFSQTPSHITLSIPAEALSVGQISDAQFFVRQSNALRYSAKQELVSNAHTLSLTIEKSNTDIPEKLSGILSVKTHTGTETSFDISAQGQPIAAVASSSKPMPDHSGQDMFLPAVLAFALIGGLILNLMPCVLPVLSLKALALVKKIDKERSETRKHGIAYTLGILVSFGVFAAILIALQQAGEHVGWGYQMQSPVFVGCLIFLLFAVGLNLSGLFDLPVLLGNTGSKLANESSARGSFFTGVLATAVATPCTAPFMASAVGVALTLPAWQAFLVFEALGLGLALPFLLISFLPALLKYLPKPGAWMETFKQVLAFPMYASVIWLLWVLTLQTSTSGMVWMLAGLLMFALIIWMKRLFTNATTYRLIATVLLVATFVFTLHTVNAIEPTKSEAIHGETKAIPYSPDALADLRATGKPVFINATAAWCITCQVNAKTAIHTDAVMAAFAKHNVTYMVADWTRKNQHISNLLASFGYQGVPLYIFYPANNGEPVILPQVLTPSIILETINPKGD